jgi:hypothetical protein
MTRVWLALDLLAWFVAVSCTLLSMLAIAAQLNYAKENNVERILDSMQGYSKTYNFKPYLWPAVLAWTWVIAGWLI